MKAVTIKEVGGSGKAEVEDVAEPTLRPGYIKVRTVAVAVNPSQQLLPQLILQTSANGNLVDWKNIAFMGQAGLRLGACLIIECWKRLPILTVIVGGDYSGIVEEIGPECHTTLKKGDPVLGGTHGANSV